MPKGTPASAVKIVVLVGPTAVGKTKYAIEMAKRLNGEIVSADSMQIYRGMDIGSAKPTPAERREAAHHLLDVRDPAQDFSAAEYQELARAAIADIAGRGRLPILSGGTGLYVNAVLYDMDFSRRPRQSGLRDRLEREAEALGPARLHERLRRADADAAARIHPNNLRKVIRALEILEDPGAEGRVRPFSEAFRPWAGCAPCLIGLMRDRQELYRRIDARVDLLMEAGLADEVKTLLQNGLAAGHTSMQGIGYKELTAYVHGLCGLDQAVESIKRNSRRYAKRQITWFKRYPNIRWFDLTARAAAGAAEETILRELLTWIRF